MAPTSLYGLSNWASVKLLSATGQLGGLFLLLGLFYFLIYVYMCCIVLCVCVYVCVYSAHGHQKIMSDLWELQLQQLGAADMAAGS